MWGRSLVRGMDGQDVTVRCDALEVGLAGQSVVWVFGWWVQVCVCVRECVLVCMCVDWWVGNWRMVGGWRAGLQDGAFVGVWSG